MQPPAHGNQSPGHMSSILYSPLPPLEVLFNLFVIDDTSPSGLRWKRSRSTAKAGDIVGSKNSGNYWQVRINRKNYKCHRIVWYMTTKEDPLGLDIDHRFGNKNNNLDIRKASRSENNRNARKRSFHGGKPTSSKFKGVSWASNANKWRAYIDCNKKRHNLGVFICELDAARAYDEAAVKYFGEFALLNRVLFPDDGL